MCPNCPIKPIAGKWKIEILASLKNGPLRASDLERQIPKANPRVIARQLRNLETNGIICRKVYAEIPLKVEYSLTENGKVMISLLKAIHQVTLDHMAMLEKNS